MIQGFRTIGGNTTILQNEANVLAKTNLYHFVIQGVSHKNLMLQIVVKLKWCISNSIVHEFFKNYFHKLISRGCHFGQKVDLCGKNTFCSQSVIHHLLSISQFLDFSNLILNSYFEVTFVTCQDG